MKDGYLMKKAPVLLFTYRKQDFLSDLYSAILRYSPPKLYISHNYFNDDSEKEAVNEVRETIKGWSFPFEVEYILHDRHLGINDSIPRSLDYVFSRENDLIILEDDTIPSESFFLFCNTMLDRYERHPEVGSIIGCNLGAADQAGVYFQSGFAVFHWGWATWASRWKMRHGTEMPWGSDGVGVIPRLHSGKDLFLPFLKRMAPEYITWDIRWGWVSALNNLCCILPGKNLVTNKGFSRQGTYTDFMNSRFRDLPAFDLSMKDIRLMSDIRFNSEYERRTASLIWEILAKRGELARYDLLDIRY